MKLIPLDPSWRIHAMLTTPLLVGASLFLVPLHAGEPAPQQRFAEIEQFHEGLAIARSEKGVGYIDTAGRVVIPSVYEGGGNFSEGLAAVSANGKKGYINKHGVMTIQPVYYEAMPFSEGLAAVCELIATKPGSIVVGKYGFVNGMGKYALEPRFDGARSFSEGLAAVSIEGKWGYIDKMGRWVIPARYKDAGDFKEGIARVSSDTERCVIDARGNKVLCTGGNILGIGEEIGEGRISVLLRCQDAPEGRWGFADFSGRIVIAPKYDQVGVFSEGLAAAWKGDKVGFIGLNGEFLIPPIFDDAPSRFIGGKAVVKVDGRYGLIDASGGYTLPPTFDWIDTPSEGMVVVEKEGSAKILTVYGAIAYANTPAGK